MLRDIICVGPVWSPDWIPPKPSYADQAFQCWLWHTTIGEAYDTLFFLNFISFYGTIVCFIYLLKETLKVEKYGKQI